MLLTALAVYEPARYQQKRELRKLQENHLKLETLKQSEILQNQKYQRQINSSQEREWVEMSMMRILGVVPENSIKIYFKSED